MKILNAFSFVSLVLSSATVTWIASERSAGDFAADWIVCVVTPITDAVFCMASFNAPPPASAPASTAACNSLRRAARRA